MDLQGNKNPVFVLEDVGQKPSGSEKGTNISSRSTTRSEPNEDDRFEETIDFTTHDEVSMVLSVLYGIMVVCLAVVFKVAETIAADEGLASKKYLCILFSIAIVWMIAFKGYSVWHQHVKGRSEFLRSPHASNRWLKGVIALFGFAIVIKDSLEVIGVSEIDNPMCEEKIVYFFKYILHAAFVLGQVIFLFFYAKIHIHEFKVCSRFGVVHAMATNLAVWIGVIADETSQAIKTETKPDDSKTEGFLAGLSDRNFTRVFNSIEAYCNNTTQLLSDLQMEESYEAAMGIPTRGLFKGNCSCYSRVCQVIARADKFLSPLLIEFCLVASCLLYCIWNHVGKETKHHKDVPKPSHKFYKSYKGVMLGAIVFVATVIEITLLGTLDSGTPPAEKSYYTEVQYLIAYEGFLLSLNLAILLACVFAFYVYSASDVKRTDASVGLDSVLLFICLVGPLIVGLFSIVSLSAGSAETKARGWTISLAAAIADVVVSLVQVQLVVYGLHREAATDVKLSYAERIYLRKQFQANLGRNISAITEADPKDTIQNNYMKELVVRERTLSENTNRIEEDTSSTNIGSVVGKMPTNNNGSIAAQERERKLVRLMSEQTVCNNCSDGARRKTLLPPNSIRLVLRETIMFLVLANTCLWIFLSLNGTIFKVYAYQAEYFGYSAWTTLVSVTAPLRIFLKLHFAACYFEIWSYS